MARELQTTPLRDSSTTWLADLAFETALGYYTPADLCVRYDLTPVAYERTSRLPEFKRAVQTFKRQIDEEGQEFRITARKMASEVLKVLFEIAGDADQNAGDRIKAVEALCRYSGFDKSAEVATNNAFVVNINM